MVAREFSVVAMWFLGCSGWLLESCNVVARVFWLLARTLQCGC